VLVGTNVDADDKMRKNQRRRPPASRREEGPQAGDVNARLEANPYSVIPQFQHARPRAEAGRGRDRAALRPGLRMWPTTGMCDATGFRIRGRRRPRRARRGMGDEGQASDGLKLTAKLPMRRTSGCCTRGRKSRRRSAGEFEFRREGGRGAPPRSLLKSTAEWRPGSSRTRLREVRTGPSAARRV